MKKVSVRTLAAALELSPATVSRSLSGNASVSPETRERVLAEARKQKYRPVNLRNQLLLVVSPRFCLGAYDQALITEFIIRCAKEQWGLMIMIESNLRCGGGTVFDGIVSLSYSAQTNRTLAGAYNCPIVVINNRHSSSNDIWAVNSDDRDAIERAVNVFVRAGHRKIGLLDIGDGGYSQKLRNGYFLEAIAMRPEREGKVYEHDPIQGFRPQMEQILSDGVTALLLPHEEMGPHLLKALAAVGARVPRDLSVITWENHLFSHLLEPPLTTFSQNYPALAENALSLIRSLLLKKRGKLINQMIPYLYCERESVAPPPQLPGR